jgi:hypothetical protein
VHEMSEDQCGGWECSRAMVATASRISPSINAAQPIEHKASSAQNKEEEQSTKAQAQRGKQTARRERATVWIGSVSAEPVKQCAQKSRKAAAKTYIGANGGESACAKRERTQHKTTRRQATAMQGLTERGMDD